MLNETIAQTIEIAKVNAYMPSLIVLWASFVINMLIVGWIFKEASGKKSWGNFWGIWGFTTIITGMILAFLIICPNAVSTIIDKIKLAFS